MDIEEFHHVNGTFGDVNNARAYGDPIRIARAIKERDQLLKAKLIEAKKLIESNGFVVVKRETERTDVAMATRVVPYRNLQEFFTRIKVVIMRVLLRHASRNQRDDLD